MKNKGNTGDVPAPERYNGYRRRFGLPTCTYNQLMVLHELTQAKADGSPFVPLDLDSRTEKSLIKRDWIFRSMGALGTAYKITGRGEKAYEVYSVPPMRRSDGLCPTCGEHPRLMLPNGDTGGYCESCERIRVSKRSHQKNPGPCSRCKINLRHVTANGTVQTYCLPCRRERATATRRQKNDELRQRIESGELVRLCYTCKQVPVHISDTGWVLDYCDECNKAYMTTYNTKRRYQRVLDKHGIKPNKEGAR